jgi:hypothetical protein
MGDAAEVAKGKANYGFFSPPAARVRMIKMFNPLNLNPNQPPKSFAAIV